MKRIEIVTALVAGAFAGRTAGERMPTELDVDYAGDVADLIIADDKKYKQELFDDPSDQE